MLSVATGLSAQSSYKSLENRFEKKVLTAKDSAAFREQGLQKIRSLFYKAELYQRHKGNLSNQAYIAQSLPDMFYVEEGDTLDLQPMLRAIDQIQKSSSGSEAELKISAAPDYLAKVETLDTQPRLTYFLILKRAPKKFGDREQMLWQVFLSVPVIEE
jgi:hypothetical protein